MGLKSDKPTEAQLKLMKESPWCYSDIPDKISGYLKIHPVTHLQTILQASTGRTTDLDATIEVTAEIERGANIRIRTTSNVLLDIDKYGKVRVLKGEITHE